MNVHPKCQAFPSFTDEMSFLKCCLEDLASCDAGNWPTAASCGTCTSAQGRRPSLLRCDRRLRKNSGDESLYGRVYTLGALNNTAAVGAAELARPRRLAGRRFLGGGAPSRCTMLASQKTSAMIEHLVERYHFKLGAKESSTGSREFKGVLNPRRMGRRCGQSATCSYLGPGNGFPFCGNRSRGG